MIKKVLTLLSFIVVFLILGSFSASAQSVTIDVKANGSDGTVLLAPGENLLVSWISTNAFYCQLESPAFSGVLLIGNMSLYPGHQFYPNTASVTYTVTCFESFGGPSVTDSVVARVAPVALPVSVSFSVSSSLIDLGQSTTLSWTSANADYCMMNKLDLRKEFTNKGTSVARTIFPKKTNTYTVTCYSADGLTSDSKSIAVRVR